MHDKKHDDVSEALMRRRHDFTKKSSAKPEMPVAPDDKRGDGEIAPPGAMPVGAADSGATAPGVVTDDAITLTPEMLMELLGSSNAPGLRGAVMQNAAGMAKKC